MGVIVSSEMALPKCRRFSTISVHPAGAAFQLSQLVRPTTRTAPLSQ